MLNIVIVLCAANFALISANPLLQALSLLAPGINGPPGFNGPFPGLNGPPPSLNGAPPGFNGPASSSNVPNSNPSSSNPYPMSSNGKSQLKEMVMSQLLSSPAIQPKINGVSNKGANNRPQGQVGPNNSQNGKPNNSYGNGKENGNTPNVINNYIIVPPEAFLKEPKHNQRNVQINKEKDKPKRKKKNRKKDVQVINNDKSGSKPVDVIIKVKEPKKESNITTTTKINNENQEAEKVEINTPGQNKLPEVEETQENQNVTTTTAKPATSKQPRRKRKRPRNRKTNRSKNREKKDVSDEKPQSSNDTNTETPVDYLDFDNTTVSTENSTTKIINELIEPECETNETHCMKPLMNENINGTNTLNHTLNNYEVFNQIQVANTQMEINNTTENIDEIVTETPNVENKIEIENKKEVNSKQKKPRIKKKRRRKIRARRRKTKEDNKPGVKVKISTKPKIKPKSADAKVLEEFRRNFPEVPDIVVRGLLSYLKDQFSAGHLGKKNVTITYNPNKTRRKNSRRRKTKKKQKKLGEVEVCDETVEVNPTLVIESVFETNNITNYTNIEEDSYVVHNTVNNNNSFSENTNENEYIDHIIQNERNQGMKDMVERNNNESIMQEENSDKENEQKNVSNISISDEFDEFENSTDTDRKDNAGISILEEIIKSENSTKLESNDNRTNTKSKDDIGNENFLNNNNNHNLTAFGSKKENSSIRVNPDVKLQNQSTNISKHSHTQRKPYPNPEINVIPTTTDHNIEIPDDELEYQHRKKYEDIEFEKTPTLEENFGDVTHLNDEEVEAEADDMDVKLDDENISPNNENFKSGELFGIIDDYYPLFSEDNEYKNLHNERYHYTTDRSVETEGFSRERRYKQDEINDKIVDNNKTTTDNTDEQRLAELEIEIEGVHPVFRPDFETKPVTKIIEKYYLDTNKLSTYSDAKTPKYNAREKEYDIGWKNRNDQKGVETYYGNSKVVKYGQQSDALHENITQDVVDFSERQLSEDNQDASLVFAYSYPYPV